MTYYQLDMFAKDEEDSKRMWEEKLKRASSKQLRFAFHLLTDVQKKLEKSPSREP